MRVTATLILLAIATLILPSCDDDSCPACPDHAECLLGPAELSFGSVCLGDSAQRTFEVIAPKTNTKPVAGAISEDCDKFEILAGGGSFTLSPGQRRSVTVEYEPSGIGMDTCLVELGVACGVVTVIGGAEECALLVSDPPELDFGTIRVGITVQDTLRITAPLTNPKPASGTISSGCQDFTVLSGDGDFVLQPGESLELVVSYAPTAAETTTCLLDVGASYAGIRCSGVGTDDVAFLAITPTSATTFDWDSNFMIDAPTVVFTGVTYENPPWNDCNREGWRVDGQVGSRHGFEIQDLLVPEGTGAVLTTFTAAVENVCVEFVVGIDGVDTYIPSGDTDCGVKPWNFPLTGGVRSIFIGTGPAAACDADVFYDGSDFSDGKRILLHLPQG